MLVTTFRDIESLAMTVWQLAGSESQFCQTAVTWLIVNRMASEQNQPDVAGVCRHVLHDAGWSEDGTTGPVSQSGNHGDRLTDPRFCRLLIRVLEVLAKEVNDPTNGARFFHRHDTAPNWSQELEPVALIGAYFFYNVPDPDGRPRGAGTSVRRMGEQGFF